MLTWKEMSDKYGTNSLTNFDLMKIARDLKLKPFRVVMRNELLKLPKTTKNIIINLDSSRGEGTHWVCLYNTPDYKFYFSSFGDNPPKEVIKFFNRSEAPVREYSDTQIQEFNTFYCGQISIYILYCLNHNMNPNEVIFSLLKKDREAHL